MTEDQHALLQRRRKPQDNSGHSHSTLTERSLYRCGEVFIPYVIERLGNRHDRAALSCGVVSFDRYFKQQVGQEGRHHTANCFVDLHTSEKTIGGYYTLSATSVMFESQAERLAKQLSRCSVISPLICATAIRGSVFGSS